MPLIDPLVEPTVTFELVLLQVPPGTASVNVIDDPEHTEKVAPPIAVGPGVTVTISVALQPASV